MLKSIITVLFCTFASHLFSQVIVNGQDINKMENVHFVRLLAFSKPFSSKVVITIDYGQPAKISESQAIQNSDGKAQNFESVIDAMNFMYFNGWNYVDLYVAEVGGQNVHHYLFEKKE